MIFVDADSCEKNAREFILKMLKDKTSKYVMSLLLARYRYLIRYFYILKDY